MHYFHLPFFQTAWLVYQKRGKCAVVLIWPFGDIHFGSNSLFVDSVFSISLNWHLFWLGILKILQWQSFSLYTSVCPLAFFSKRSVCCARSIFSFLIDCHWRAEQAAVCFFTTNMHSFIQLEVMFKMMYLILQPRLFKHRLCFCGKACSI